MALPEITVAPGSDPQILAAPGAVSGFESWTPGSVEGLMGLIRDEMLTMFKRAPAPLGDAFGPRLHMPVYNSPGMRDTAQLLHAARTRLVLGPPMAGNRREILGYQPGDILGFKLNTNDPWNAQAVRRSVGHETLHVLSSKAVHMYFYAAHEALTGRMEREYYGPDPIGNNVQWDAGRFGSTTGLCPPDFAAVTFSPRLRHALYISAGHALKGIQAEQIWQMWAVLTDQTRRTGLLPRWKQIEDALLVAAGEAGAAALREPTLRQMRPGAHVMTFPTLDKRAQVYSFVARQRPDYGAMRPGAGRQESLYETEDVATGPCQVSLLNSADRPFAAISSSLGTTTHVTFEEIVSRMHPTDPVTQKIKGEMGTRMTVEIPGVPPFELRKAGT